MSANHLKKKIKNAQRLSLAGSITCVIGKLFPLSGIQSKNTFEHHSSPNTILFLFVQFKASYAIESFLQLIINLKAPPAPIQNHLPQGSGMNSKKHLQRILPTAWSKYRDRTLEIQLMLP